MRLYYSLVIGSKSRTVMTYVRLWIVKPK